MRMDVRLEPYQNRRHAIETCAKRDDVGADVTFPCKAITTSTDAEVDPWQQLLI